MQSRYKLIISNRNLIREVELNSDTDTVKIGTGSDCDVRFHKDLFFEKIQMTFIRKDNIWSVFCSDNLYIDVGDVRKLLTVSLSHGDVFNLKYQNSNNVVFTIEFLIDFDNGQRKYERAIDLTNVQTIRIGADNRSNVVLSSGFVNRDAVELKKFNTGYSLNVFETTYGVYHNGSKAMNNCIIKNGDFFSISDFIFYYKDNTLWTEIRDGMQFNGLNVLDYPNPNDYPKFNRNTRVKTVVCDEKIEILDPPAKPKKPKSNIIMTLLPSLGMILASGIMATMGGSGMMVMSVVSGVMAILTSIIGLGESSKEYKHSSKNRIEQYNAYINKKKKDIQGYREQEAKELEEVYSSQDVERDRLFSFSSDLFDRTPNDEDFLCVRLGSGDVSSKREVNYKKQEKLELEDELQEIPEKLRNEFKNVQNAPIVCDLKQINAIGVVGSRKYRFEFFKNIVIDIAARHYFTDVKMFFVAEQSHVNQIRWLRMLPHAYEDTLGIRNIVCDDESKNLVFEYLYNELTAREQSKTFDKRLVVFFYDEYGFKSHPISKFVEKAKDLGVTFIFFANSVAEIPLGCSFINEIVDETNANLIDAQNRANSKKYVYPTMSIEQAMSIVNLLAPVYTEEISLEGTLTKNITMFELLNILVVDDLDLGSRWSNSQVFKSMSAPLGVSKTGVVNLDLHDKAHGPHGLVAGTTGSGKSEILQTYILAMSTLFHPYEVGFVIIDFKGGGMVNQFKELPHLLGAITNIDGKEINRSLKSIKAELQKRQRLFAEADVNHIDKYIKKFKSGEVEFPLPHLIIIVDEFAELKAEQPEFMKELISAARIGRSLGVHLILATQKPSGQVDDQIWSNSRFKLCLKVQSQEDSNEVLKSPLAAEIKEPGRAYLQVGNNEIFELFQSAYSGAAEKMDDSNVKEFTIMHLTDSGKRIPVYSRKKRKSSGTNLTQLESLVSYIGNYCKDSGIECLPNICLPSLLSVIDYPDKFSTNKEMVGIGIYDDPDNQIQDVAFLDVANKNTIIIGSSQCGKTNILQSVLRTVSTTFAPDEASVYILDFSSMVFKKFENLNHVGGVVCSSEDEKLKNLFKLLFDEIAIRKEKLVSVGVSSFASYLEAGYTDIPNIYLLIDNLTALIELYLEDDDSLLNIIREGLSVGISTVVANSQTAGIGYKYLSNFANKIAFHCNDSTEYANIFESTTMQPDDIAGRCIVELDKRILECQTYLAFNGEKEIERVQQMQKFVSEANIRYKNTKAKRIPCIPSTLTKEDIVRDFNAVAEGYILPIGLTYNEVEPYYLDISQLSIMGLCGKENTGHKNFVQFLLDTLEANKEEYPSKVVIFDDIKRKFECFKSFSVVEHYAINTESVTTVLNEWYSILNERYETLMETGEVPKGNELLLMLIQNNDVAKVINDDLDMMDQFNEMMSRFKGMNVAFVFTNYSNASLSYDAPEPLRQIRQEQHIIFFEDLDNLKVFDVPYDDLKANKKRLERGDAYYIKDNTVVKLKMIKA